MISVSGKNWEETMLNKRIVDKVKYDNELTDIVSKIVISRKFSQTEVYSLHNHVEISNPFINYPDFKNGVSILKDSLKKNQKILVIGDYDVDGCISTSLFVNFFKHINKNCTYYIPNRFKDGYGASLKLIKKLVKKKPDLIIMVDCGSNSVESVNFLNSKKIRSIIIDHHEIYKPYPKSECLINPKKDCNYDSYNYLCASTLVFFFIDFFIKENSIKLNFNNYLIYVLLASLCDVMPLRNLNRNIAIKVLNEFNIKNTYIINKIFTLKKINRPLEIEDLNFLIGPILNSAGRLNDPNIVVELLTNESLVIKEKILTELIKLNEKRKIIEEKSIKEYNFDLIKKDKSYVLVKYEIMMNLGLIGIVASRLKDYFNKPCVILSKFGDEYKASARSNMNFNIGKYIKQAIDKKIILNGGGHNLAAGFSIKKNQIDVFKKFINSMFLKHHTKTIEKFIAKISLHSINDKFYNELQKVGPYGPSNVEPIFLIENLRIIKPVIIKNKFISFLVKSHSGKLVSGISFNRLESPLSKKLLNDKNEMSLLVKIKQNIWNNKKKLQLIVIDLIDFTNKT